MRPLLAAISFVAVLAAGGFAWDQYTTHQADQRMNRAIQSLEEAGEAVSECRDLGGC